jgi:hypothetical protein
LFKSIHVRKLVRFLGVIFFCFFLYNQTAWGQNSSILKNWTVGANGGLSYLVMELEKNFQNSYVEMNSQAAGTFSFHVTKVINYNLDVSVEYNGTFFSGYKRNPSNVNWLMKSYFFNNERADFEPYPVEYHTELRTVFGKVKYHLSPFYSYRKNYTNTNLYYVGGIGWSSIGVELAFSNPEDAALTGLRNPLFAKGGEGRTPRSTYVSFMSGVGLRFLLSERFALDLEANVSLIDADYLDGVHNYRSDLTPEINTGDLAEGYRVPVYDIVGSFQIGLSYQFDLKRKSQNVTRGGQWQTKNKGFSNERYHDKSKQQIQKPQLPFAR